MLNLMKGSRDGIMAREPSPTSTAWSQPHTVSSFVRLKITVTESGAVWWMCCHLPPNSLIFEWSF